MQLPIFQVNAFNARLFSGNPAAVCPLKEWLPTQVMQQIALENAVPETAFFIQQGESFGIRWFTPEIEMDLCGHATLAAAHVLIHHLQHSTLPLRFQSNSGELRVTIEAGLLTLDFPSRLPQPTEAPQIILDGIGTKPIEVLKARDYVLVFKDEDMIQQMQPNRALLDQINLDPGGIIVTAPGKTVDFVSRFFTPQASIFEDPVTGSAHTSLIPYWSKKLGKTALVALQLSPRVGKLICQDRGDRVFISGAAVTYLEGQITVPLTQG
ncbi:PhzF family phenazine biosynthesis protein [Phormidium tenue FACHB-886]|nr:PhzF family phenazine biosynthesis protein [Phormidium tenue FACHB-886]